MIVTIEFELPEDEEDYKSAVFGSRYKAALVNLEKRLRQEMKYEIANTGEHYVELFYEVMNEEGVTLE